MNTLGVLLLAAATATSGFGKPHVGGKKFLRAHAVQDGPPPPGGPIQPGSGCIRSRNQLDVILVHPSSNVDERVHVIRQGADFVSRHRMLFSILVPLFAFRLRDVAVARIASAGGCGEIDHFQVT